MSPFLKQYFTDLLTNHTLYTESEKIFFLLFNKKSLPTDILQDFRYPVMLPSFALRIEVGLFIADQIISAVDCYFIKY